MTTLGTFHLDRPAGPDRCDLLADGTWAGGSPDLRAFLARSCAPDTVAVADGPWGQLHRAVRLLGGRAEPVRGRGDPDWIDG